MQAEHLTGAVLKRILFACDGSESFQRVLKELPRLGLPGGLYVRVLSVAEIWMPMQDGLSDAREEDLPRTMWHARERARHYFASYGEFAARAAEELRQVCPAWSVEAIVSMGPPAATILNHARRWEANGIVLGSPRHAAIARFVCGDVARTVAQRADCPVWILGGGDAPREDSWKDRSSGVGDVARNVLRARSA